MSNETRGDRSAEERAEAMMERVTGETSRFFGRLVGRAREEVEDMLAEARTINRGGAPDSGARPGTRSDD